MNMNEPEPDSSSSSEEEENEGGEGKEAEESSDDDDMELEDSENEKKLKEINSKLAIEPYSYDLRVAQIELLKNVGDLDLLRDARQKLSEMYPLNKKIWLDWIRDEVRLVTTNEEKEAVKQLFEKAIKDYLSVEIWNEYIAFTLAQLTDDVTDSNGDDGKTSRKEDLDEQIENCRMLFERALSNCALHFQKGSQIWNSYRDFEISLINICPDKEDALLERVKGITKRQISLPLRDVDKSFENIKSLKKIEFDESFQNELKKTSNKIKELELKEKELIECKNEAKKVQLYQNYIESEIQAKSKTPAIQCLYERAIEDHPLYSALWTNYIDYLSKNLKIADLILSVCERASRNCSWDVNIWLLYITQAEKLLKDTSIADAKEKVKSIFEKSLLYHPSGDNVTPLWLRYLEFLRRLINYDYIVEEDLTLLLKTFDAAEQHLCQLYQDPNENICQIATFRLRVEANSRKSMNSTRDKWNELIQRGYGEYYKVWSQYISLEIRFGDLTTARRLFNKAASTIKDDINSLSELWLNFERDFGTYETLETCKGRIAKIITKIYEEEQLKKQKIAEKIKPRQVKDIKPVSRDRESLKDRYPISDGRNNFNNEKVNNSDQNRGTKRNAPSSNEGERPAQAVEETETKKFKPADLSEKCKLFVKGISYKASDNKIRKLFEQYGVVADLRVPMKGPGQNKGIAFVDFAEEAGAALAIIKLDGTEFYGKNLSVALSCPPKKGAGGDHKPGEGTHGDSKNQSEFKVPGVPPASRSFHSSNSNNRSRNQPEPEYPIQRRHRNSFVPRAVQLKK